MPAISLKGHFDGPQIQLDEPFELPRNVLLLVTVLSPSRHEQERQGERKTHRGLKVRGESNQFRLSEFLKPPLTITKP